MKTITRLTLLWGLTAILAAQIPDFTPQTPLIGALLHNNLVEAKRLVHAGVDPNQGQFNGLSPLALAVLRQDVDLVRLMTAKGADLNFRDPSGSTILMWAAFSESGNASVVEEILREGADPSAVNNAGESALTWALKRGETPAAAALRRAGASNHGAIKTSVEKAVALLQRSGAQFQRISGCVSCHHQFLPQLAVAAAKERGLRVDEETARRQMDWMIGILKPLQREATKNRDRIPDPPISVSYGLIALASQHRPGDSFTNAMAQMVGAWQEQDGAFHTLPAIRPPIEASSFAATALSIRAIQVYGSNPMSAIHNAAKWLKLNEPRTTEDRAMQLLGLAWAKVPAEELQPFTERLLAEQRSDGGWAQLANVETDAYATGQALVALEAAGYSTASPEYQRGVSYLMRTQFPDGSWLVRSRAFPVQPLQESGFPHGKNQWISAAGTSWAAIALSLSLPRQEVSMGSR